MLKLPLSPELRQNNISLFKRCTKRLFDIILALSILPVIAPVTLILIVLAKMFNGNGLFVQRRIGRYGESFNLYKICSMRHVEGYQTNVTTDTDPRITRFGHLIRKTKLDEFPQLINVLKGEMSFVGPRPDVPEAYEGLKKEDAIVLSIRPGITGAASIKFKNEQSLLASVSDPESYNRDVIFPAKIKINKDYITHQSLWLDLKIMLGTVIKHSS